MSGPPSPWRKQPAVIAQPEEDDFPELLDQSLWTQSATFAQGDKYTGPSARIGRYYRQGLNELDGKGLEKARAERTAPLSPLRPTIERKGWAAGLACRPLLDPLAVSASDSASDLSSSGLGILQRQREAAMLAEQAPFAGTSRTQHITDPAALEERKAKYVREQIDGAVLAPFNNNWMEAAMEQVPTELAGVPPEVVDDVLDTMVGEVHEGYFEGVKQSMVEYVLKSSAEAKRLEITRPPPKFQTTTFHPSMDESVAECAAPKTHDSLALGAWHDSVLAGYESIERGLVVNHDGMMTMLELWATYEPLRLCTLASLPTVTAMEPDKFKDMQHTHCERVVQTLKKKWFPAVVDIFRREGGGHEDEAGAPLLSAVSTLMFNQLRGLLHASLAEFVAFFEKFACAPDAFVDDEPYLQSEAVDHRPLFIIKMQVEAEAFKPSPNLPTLLKTVLGTIDHFVAMLNTIPRIEAEMGRASGGAARLLTVATPDEELIVQAKQRLHEIVEANFEASNVMMRVYTPYAYLLTADTEKKVVDFNNAKHQMAEVTAEIAKYDKAKKSIEKASVAEVRFNLVSLAVGLVQGKLASRALELSDKMRHAVKAAFVSTCHNLCQRYMDIFVRLGQHPNTDDEMVELENFLGESTGLLVALNADLNEARKLLRFLTEQAVGFESEQLSLIGDTWLWPSKIKPKVAECNQKLKAERNRAEEELNMKKERFLEELDEYVRQAEEFADKSDIDKWSDNMATLNALQAKIKECKERGAGMNEEEELLGQPRTLFEQLEEVPKIMGPFLALWTMVQDFTNGYQSWMHGPMSAIDPEVLESEVKTMYKGNIKILKGFESDESPKARNSLKVSETLKERIGAFQAKLPLVCCLTNRGMRDRHWKAISDATGQRVEPNAATTLEQMLRMKLDKHLEVLDEVAGSASKEYSLEKALDKMLADWQPLEYMLKEYRDTGTCIMAGSEEVQALLDDHIVKSQTMQGSPAIKPFEERARKWATKLVLIQDLIDIWLKVQGVWQYLEPIFGSEDIMRQMPEEGKLFKKQDGMWRDNVKKVLKDVRVLVVADIPGLVESYREQHAMLEVVQKGLNDYLEMKRLYFPRFFFLSNDEMLEILSETKDPLRVQPHLGKCFEGIGKLVFEENNLITGMVSGEGEVVPFGGDNIQPTSMVEQWLVEVEEKMFSSMARVMRESDAAYKGADRVQWMQEWQGQVVIGIAGVAWTAEVESSLAASGAKGLAEYGERFQADLEKTVELVRGDLPKLVRKVVAPLIVIDVHARDVVQDMAKKGIASDKEFDWLAQLRYYPDPDENMDIKIRMVSTTLPYGYEYLGLQGRLVVTPLTDRCYRTLMGALQLDLGGAPEGPAGTGKTETTKDLAKALAKQCVVFNCSDGLDYLAMAKFFKGLAASGAWACFDEFNRIDLEVLSVIAQQILTIQEAVKAKAERFVFEGRDIPLNRGYGVFITMNPGYAGRAELPDNLKVLFRTVAMMVPDYAMIGEVMLLSSGYLEARPCARKIVQTYKLCSEQLSSQDHYDYGMRAVMAVLRAAANLKQQFPDANESELMLRSILDVNLPKFLQHDVPLFEGITSDLFPGVELPKPDYDLLNETCQWHCDNVNLQLTDLFFIKITQLYEMIIVRHGLMIVGYSYGAKTCMYRTLGAALTEMKARGAPQNAVSYYVLNPKSITMGQLYGQFDPVTHEWSDGILAVTYRYAAQQEKIHGNPDRQWVMFDGPVDAIWIENMNTVLDDNKKLCLMSGEMIGMSSVQSMIFEVQDLAVASPATVSRCGMVYTEPSQIGWEPLLASWLNELPVGLKPFKEKLNNLFGWLVPPALRFCRLSCKATMDIGIQATDEVTRVRACMKLLTALTHMLEDEGKAKELEKELPAWVENLFLFSLTWSVAGVITGEGRPKFDAFLREICAGKAPRGYDMNVGGADGVFGTPQPWLKFIPEGEATCYEYMFNQDNHKWMLWVDTIRKEDTKIPPTATFETITVPTLDTARYSFLFEKLLMSNKPALFVGPTGTGKTAYVQKLILSLDAKEWSSIFVNYSAQTHANQAQDIIDGKLDKRKKGVFGPPIGKRAIIFVDDLNMPALETYGAQPPIEILRQYMDHDGWYDRKEHNFRKLVDLSFVCAMGPPGGGRNTVTPRYLRHFNIIAYTAFDDASMQRIFQSILDWWLQKEGFDMSFVKISAPIIAATMDMYKAAMLNLLPTPSKSHYTFNLRDFARVVQGMLLSSAADFEKPSDLMLLWSHELFRVFYDRLVDDDDRLWFIEQMKVLTVTHFNVEMDKLFKEFDMNCNGEVDDDDVRYLLYSSYTDPKAPKKAYKRVKDLDGFQKLMVTYLDDYNQISSKPMKLVLFLFAVEHVCKIARVLQMPRGNALLAGVGGSGRQSVTRLAAHLADMDVFGIEVSKTYSLTDWRDDLKKVLRMAGEQGKPTVFFFADTQIKEEAYLEDINGLLNAGEVPNLFDNSEKAEISDKVREEARNEGKDGDGTPTTLFAYFVVRCRALLHMCLAMSPIGDAFRTRLRMFPSLVNCCTIDWFRPWPADALDAVASTFLADVEMEKHNRQSTVEMCKIFHESVRILSDKFRTSERREVYVTPTAYLELIQVFQTLLAKKRKEIDLVRKRYDNGLEQLRLAGEAVVGMQAELTELKPNLLIAVKEAGEMAVVIDKEVKEVIEPKKEFVAKEEAAVGKVAATAKEMKDSCEADLAEAMPALESAVKALDTIKKPDIDLIKGMGNPPAAVKLILEGVCVMKGVKAEKIKDPNDQTKKIEDYFGPAKKMMGDAKAFVDSLKSYDKDNISPAVMKVIREKYKPMEMFTPEAAAKGSSAAEGLCRWILAMEIYDRVAKVVAPKKAQLAVAEGEYAEAMKGLKAKQDELKVVLDKLKAMQDKLAELDAKKTALENQYEDCNNKLERAEKLMGGLGGEQVRWSEISAELGPKFNNLLGDVLLSSGVIAYLGPFTIPYRKEAIAGWQALCIEKRLPMSDVFGLQAVIGEPVKIRGWILQGLPTDDFSIDNGIVTSVARRWPLMIDPQGQANKWIKNMESEAGLLIIKLTQGDFLRTLENAIQFGKPVMCENVLEVLDPALEPLLVKQTFKSGGVECMRLGDATIEYSKDFKFYITTKLSNPHYLPELQVKVTLLNFMITPAGLEDQLLGIVVAKERPDLEEEKSRLVLESASNKKQLKEIEDKILEVLSGEGNILEDASAINILGAAKVLGNEIAEKQKIADETEIKIDEARNGYKPVAYRTSLLYFCIALLSDIDPMYQYSLDWFVNLFIRAIADSEPSSDLRTRMTNLDKYFQYFLYRNVCRSLFEKDKLVFSLLLCVALLQGYDRLDYTEWRYLLTGGILLDAAGIDKKPPDEWVSEKMWQDINCLGQLPFAAGFPEKFAKDVAAFRPFFDAAEPYLMFADLPSWTHGYSEFQKMLVLRTIRLDKLMPTIAQFIANDVDMGQRYIEPPPFDLEGTFKDSTSTSPLVFILSPGVDPMMSLLKFAEAKGRNVEAISLGQGQGPHAERMVKQGQKDGAWVVLQNCHVFVSWMVALEKLVEEMDPKTTSNNFRLWLTSYPSPAFPVLILQNGVKMTNEPPKGVRANMLGSYLADPISDPEFFNKCEKQDEFRKMLFGLCFMHAWLQERLKYGPLGWNIPYAFGESDLRISVRQLQMFLDLYDEVPLAALNYLTAECNYGGRVTDDKDRRTLTTAVANIYCEGILKDGFKFTASGSYQVPVDELQSHEATMEYIKQWPLMPAPEVFGFNDNADITKDLKEVAGSLTTILITQSTGGGGGGAKTFDEIMTEMSKDILNKLPDNFDMETAMRRYPVMYSECKNTVICQELQKFNKLLDRVRGSLQSLQKAVKGLVVMDANLEGLSKAMLNNTLPVLWAKVSYPSLKPLSSYIAELLDRLAFFQSWLDDGPPVVFQMPHFFFVQAFMTGVMQNYARKYTIPIDTIEFDFEFLADRPDTPPEDGAFTHGLFIEGARMNDDIKLDEALPKVLFAPMCVVVLKPCEGSKLSTYPHYECPCYRTTERRGVLATTGHSSNFVMFIRVPTNYAKEHWITAGVALFNSLSD